MYIILLYLISVVIVGCVLGEIIHGKNKRKKARKLKKIEYLLSHDITDEEFPDYKEQQFINRFDTNIWELR